MSTSSIPAIPAIPADFYVYAHRRATTGEIFYIGKGTKRRAWDCTGRSPYWNNIFKKHGCTVEIIQDGLQEWAAFELECDLIALFGRKDCKLGPLVNGTDGGEGSSGAVASDESRKKRSSISKVMWQDEAMRQQIVASITKSAQSQDFKDKVSENSKKMWRAHGHREKASASILRAWENPELRQKSSKRMKIAMQSQEWRESISMAAKASWADKDARSKRMASMAATMQTPEYSANMSAALKVAFENPEARAKMSQSSKQNWQSQEYREKIHASLKATTNTPEYREQASARNKAIWANEELRKKHSEHMKDILDNPETRKKKSEGAKRAMSNPEYKSAAVATLLKAVQAKSKPVLCVSTGQVFPSAAAVERFLRENGFPKASNACISSACRGRTSHAYGFTWAFA